jgi:UDP-glucose 4-epimerase
MQSKYFVTGAAGFIGSNLVDKLLSQNYSVVGYDNFSTGKKEFLEKALQNSRFKLIEGDILDFTSLANAMKGCGIVFHLAANADVKDGLKHPTKDLQQNTLGTSNVLEAMRNNNIKKIVFSSTGSVYGEAKQIPTREDEAFPIQTSLYGASKLACEGLIQAYCEGYDFQAWIFRFVSILGERYSHGHVLDFRDKLKKDPTKLEVLGNGNQTKSYLYVQDCIDGIFILMTNSNEKVNIFNLGTEEYCSVKDSIGWITKELNVNPKLKYTGGDQGWIGDNQLILLDITKARELGWEPKVSIKEAILKTLEYLKEQNNG